MKLQSLKQTVASHVSNNALTFVCLLHLVIYSKGDCGLCRLSTRRTQGAPRRGTSTARGSVTLCWAAFCCAQMFDRDNRGFRMYIMCKVVNKKQFLDDVTFLELRVVEEGSLGGSAGRREGCALCSEVRGELRWGGGGLRRALAGQSRVAGTVLHVPALLHGRGGLHGA